MYRVVNGSGVVSVHSHYDVACDAAWRIGGRVQYWDGGRWADDDGTENR